jgi:tetratricopeptide (TPR) repeat protein
LAAIFAGAALIDLLVNLAVNEGGIQMYDGAVTYSDGGQLRRLVRTISLPEIYFDAQNDFYQGKYQQALDKCQQLREEGKHQAPIYELCWEALEKQEDYEAIIGLYHDFKAHHQLKFQDYLRLAKAYQQLGQLEEAHKYYDHCSYLDYTNATPRYEKGRILMNQGYYGPALEELQLSNNLQADHQDTLALMAACHLHFNRLQACEEVLLSARKLDPALENAAANYYWGLFQEKKGNDEEALTALQRASELGFQHHGLPMKMDDLERAVKGKP